MGKVYYKFEYNQYIDDPTVISFGGQNADLYNDKQEGYLIEGEVDDVYLRITDNALNIFVESSGRVGQTWTLSVEYDGEELEEYPINGTFEFDDFLTLNENYRLK